jgi:hypothetical protein
VATVISVSIRGDHCMITALLIIVCVEFSYFAETGFLVPDCILDCALDWFVDFAADNGLPEVG